MVLKHLLKRGYKIYLGLSLGKFGRSSWLSPYGTYLYKKKIRVGDDVYIGKGAYISATEGLHIGNGVAIGPEVMIMGGDHKFDVAGKKMHQLKSGGENRVITIEDDVWIGGRVTILKGVTVGEGAIIGAGAIVTRNVSPYSIYAGNPARRIGVRFKKEQLQAHLQSVGSKYTCKMLASIYE